MFPGLPVVPTETRSFELSPFSGPWEGRPGFIISYSMFRFLNIWSVAFSPATSFSWNDLRLPISMFSYANSSYSSFITWLIYLLLCSDRALTTPSEISPSSGWAGPRKESSPSRKEVEPPCSYAPSSTSLSPFLMVSEIAIWPNSIPSVVDMTTSKSVSPFAF